MSDGIFSKQLIKKYIIASAVTIAISVISLFISALILLMLDDPDPYYRTAAMISLAVSAIISGGAVSKIVGAKLSSAVVGCFMSVILFVMSLIFFERTDSPLLSLVLHISYAALFFAGGLLFSRKRNNRRRHRKRRK